MKKSKYILLLTIALITVLLSSCRDEWGTDNPTLEEAYEGELIQFVSGTTDVDITRAASTYYMPDAYRFVCRMYYKAQIGSEEFDVSGHTDQTAWLKVDGNIGNSLYWNKNYTDVSSEKGPGGVDNYGNDYDAMAFYWQNRKEHAFLAWTDLNHATNMVGGDAKGQLKFQSDFNYRVYSNETVLTPELDYYEIYGIAAKFANQEEMEAYVIEHGHEPAFRTAQEALEAEKQWTWSLDQYHYRHGKQYKYSREHAYLYSDTKSYDIRWYQEFMYFETIAYEPVGTYDTVYSQKTGEETIIAYLKRNDIYVAKAEYQDGSYTYNQTDEYGNLIYNENNPQFTFYYGIHYVYKEGKRYDDYPCNTFDLTRGEKTSMAQQPDIAQALTLQAPSGATQEANRVNLYFRHQFSQIQVNVKNSADNSVVLEAGDIEKVELLGVTDTGYVFTELDKEGKVHAAAYKEIDFSKYTEQQLKDNPYGTAFNMFVMPSAQTAMGYLKSFNCLTFGQLQAIRITWHENGDGNTIHNSTFRIPNTELVNLQSGMRYIWNIEVRRGTLAIIRTEIVDWELPEDAAHNGSADGTIQN